MKKHIKLLLLALGFGLSLFSVAAHASCDPCNDPNPPPECDDDDDDDDGDSMPESVVIDDMQILIFADEVALATAPSGSASSEVK
ncbi:MAG: hypothetical protein H2172_16450 [Opitutus sp.]|nr:hypothetical protein [Opitutus sp.]MCS6274415.1 hypothetical protein [Opitutus sp.]MCS6299773.1 hypothetical protein [Opitutus sp.]